MALWQFTAQGPFIPSFSSSATSYLAEQIGIGECLPGLFLWQRNLGFPKSDLVVRLRLPGIADPITFLQRLNAQPSEMFAKSVTDQRRPIAFGLTGSANGRLQQFLIENNLNCFHC